MYQGQLEYEIGLEWGLPGVRRLDGQAALCVIVDVLSFSTSVDIGCGFGAALLPYRLDDDGAAAFAAERKAQLAGKRSRNKLSMSPVSMRALSAGSRLVLPSPNGAALSLACAAGEVVAGCLRNAAAVAEYAGRQGVPIRLIAAGEHTPEGELRFAFEDFIGAGAIIHRLAGSKSPEAQAAEVAFQLARHDLLSYLRQCTSGAELLERGFADDIELAAQLDVSTCVPRLQAGEYRAL